LLASVLGAFGIVPKAASQPAVEPPPGPGGELAPHDDDRDVTPARLSFVDGDVSFWRPGAEDWGPAHVNTPLSPGDTLFAGRAGNLEIQVGPRAFLRGTDGTQIGLDTQEPDYLQFRVTGGHASLDIRELPTPTTIELATPGAAITVERPGYYRVDVEDDATTLRVHRGGVAIVTPPGRASVTVSANQQVVIRGDAGAVAIGQAAELTEWDEWNYKRTGYLIQHADTRHVSPGTYGTEALGQHGTWRTVESYGSVWVPSGMPAGWVPYSTGRWIWDPRFGWTWLDDAPWGWAPYHYGRWVFVSNVWAWAPGPIIARPVYAPALVVFLGGARISVGRPVCWAPLGWGEPVVPWWGRRGFVGVPWWGGWGGPRVVNNVVINRQRVVNVTHINVYKNVHVTNAVVGVPDDRFGRGRDSITRIAAADVRQLKPVHGRLEVKPVSSSLVPAVAPAVKPPADIRARAVVATRPRQDVAPALRQQGLEVDTANAPSAAERIVPAPRAGRTREGAGQPGPADRSPRDGATATPGVAPTPGRGADTGRGVDPRTTPPVPGAPRDSTRNDVRDGRTGQGQARPAPVPPSSPRPLDRDVPPALGQGGTRTGPDVAPPPMRDRGPARGSMPATPERQVIPDRRSAPERPAGAPPAISAPPRPAPSAPSRSMPSAPPSTPDSRRSVAPPATPPAPRPAPVPPPQSVPDRGRQDRPAPAPPETPTPSPRGAVPPAASPQAPPLGRGAPDRPAVAPAPSPRSAPSPSQERPSGPSPDGRRGAIQRPPVARPASVTRQPDSLGSQAPRRPASLPRPIPTRPEGRVEQPVPRVSREPRSTPAPPVPRVSAESRSTPAASSPSSRSSDRAERPAPRAERQDRRDRR
jgi:hypothetical protein